jgi:FtsH-binding integral membrane protein
MRSRSAPNARAEPVPIECTPDTSRQALPAIFWTTPSATEICPSPVARRSLVAGLTSVLVVTGVVSLVLEYVGMLIRQDPLFMGKHC